MSVYFRIKAMVMAMEMVMVMAMILMDVSAGCSS